MNVLCSLDSVTWFKRRTKTKFLGSGAQLQSCHLLQVGEHFYDAFFVVAAAVFFCS